MLLMPSPIPSLARWHVPQERPLVPKLWKNAFLLLSSIGPFALYVETRPVGSRNGKRLGMMAAEATVASARPPPIASHLRLCATCFKKPHFGRIWPPSPERGALRVDFPCLCERPDCFVGTVNRRWVAIRQWKGAEHSVLSGCTSK